MRLFSLVFIALRTIDEETEIRVHPLLITQESQETALKEAEEAMMSLFPPSEQWVNHRMFWMEIEQGQRFDDGRRLMWHLEDASEEAGVNHGKDSTIE